MGDDLPDNLRVPPRGVEDGHKGWQAVSYRPRGSVMLVRVLGQWQKICYNLPMRKLLASLIAATTLSISLATPAMAAPTPEQCNAAQTGINNLRKLATQYPQYASIYNAMADREAQAARASGCPNVR